MNSNKILNIILALTLLVVILKSQMINPNTKTEQEMNDANSADKAKIILGNIHSRVSIRRFTDKPVEKATLEEIVKAGMSAPTAANKQPWKFIVIANRKTLDELAEELPYAKMLKDAPAAIVVCGDTSKTLAGIEAQFWIQDCSAASENILLAVHAKGLGAVWTAVYPMQDRMKFVSKTLELAENLVPLNVIPIGYPDGKPPAKNKWKPENVIYKN